MTSYARAHVEELGGRTDWEAAAIEAFATGWARGQFRQRFCDFFREVGAIIENRGSPRRITGKLIAGKLPTRPTVTFVGGNLSCLVPLIGSPYRASIETQNKWLVLEEVNEPPHRIDRMLAQLMLAGLLERCAGILVGDFRDDSGDLQEAAVASLRKQLAHWGRTPIVTTRDVGHIWPLAPLPIGRPIALRRAGRTGIGVIQLSVPWTTWSRIDGRAGDQ
jgi:muramoyltetrapeptide carboxypeptidase LdcA involved in peptidoglycan recycling